MTVRKEQGLPGLSAQFSPWILVCTNHGLFYIIHAVSLQVMGCSILIFFLPFYFEGAVIWVSWIQASRHIDVLLYCIVWAAFV